MHCVLPRASRDWLKSKSMLTGSPGVGVFEWEGEAVVYSCQLDDGILYYHPVCVLHRERYKINTNSAVGVSI